MAQVSSSRQNHAGADASTAQTRRQSSQQRSNSSQSSRQSSGANASRSAGTQRKTGKRVEVQTTPERRTTVTRGATVSEVLRITPATRQVTTTYGHVACQFSLEIKIELGGQPTPVTLPPPA